MTLKPGTRLGPFEILALLGVGGMGEVYKGRDTRLDRLVALKLLAPHLTGNPEARERFEREAKTVANLRHPNICVLYDIGKDGGRDFLVLEYLEGETLAQRVAKGPLPLEQVLQYATEIADALDKAHRAGVTHRDIKPGNVMVVPKTGSGPKTTTQLLDFGLAKLKQEVTPNLPRSEWPTGMGAPTVLGTILGTPHYMAPEQAEGKVDELDARTDIFSFGATVYELVTGKKAFDGQTPTSVIAKILETDPPSMSSLQPLTPPALDRVVKKCLRKNPDDRWQTARDVTEELEWIAGGQGATQASVAPPVVAWRTMRDRLGWIAASVFFVIAAVALGVGTFRNARPDEPTVKVSVVPPENAILLPDSTPIISPDGRRLAFVARDTSGRTMLWVRPLDSIQAQPLAGTDGASYPFWSPDSRFLGFFAGGKLKKIEASGGAAQTLADASGGGRGGTWGRNGVIVFAPAPGGLYSVSAAGGAAAPATSLDPSRKESNHRFPYFLPDSRHFLYLSSSGGETNAIYVGQLGSKETKQILAVDSRAEFAAPGYLLFRRDETLLAQPFDAQRLELSGEATPVAEQVGPGNVTGAANFSVSDSGVLAYRGGNSRRTQLTWFDRSGKRLASVGEPGNYQDVALSPDEKRVAVARRDRPGMGDIWLLELSRGVFSRFTFNPSDDIEPVWSPDASQIVFSSNRARSNTDLYQKPSNGIGNEELLLKSEFQNHPTNWSLDGRFLLFENNQDPKTGFDLWVLPMVGDRKPFPFLQANFIQVQGEFSPDGKWIAYMSNESGRYEVYIQSFPQPIGKWQVSTNGGAQPLWRKDGKELFYLALDGTMMAVPLKAGVTLEPGIPKELFQTGIAVNPVTDQFVVTGDGQRFLLVAPVGEESATPITLVLNWAAGIKK